MDKVATVCKHCSTGVLCAGEPLRTFLLNYTNISSGAEYAKIILPAGDITTSRACRNYNGFFYFSASNIFYTLLY